MSSYDEHLISQAGGDGDEALRDNLLVEVTARNERLMATVREQAAKLEKVAAYCEQAASRISTDPEASDYERGFDDSTRGMSARIRAALESKP